MTTAWIINHDQLSPKLNLLHQSTVFEAREHKVITIEL